MFVYIVYSRSDFKLMYGIRRDWGKWNTTKNLSWIRLTELSWDNVFSMKKNINVYNNHYLTFMPGQLIHLLLRVIIVVIANVEMICSFLGLLFIVL